MDAGGGIYHIYLGCGQQESLDRGGAHRAEDTAENLRIHAEKSGDVTTARTRVAKI